LIVWLNEPPPRQAKHYQRPSSSTWDPLHGPGITEPSLPPISSSYTKLQQAESV